MHENPGVRGVFGRRHLPEMRTSILVDWDEILPAEWVRTHNKNELVWVLHNGSTVWAKPLFDDKAVGKGPTLGFAGIDEATDVPWRSREKLRYRLRQPKTGRRLFETTNPDGPEHPLFLEYGAPAGPPEIDIPAALAAAEAGRSGELAELAAQLQVDYQCDDRHQYLSACSLENRFLDPDYHADLLRGHASADAHRFVTGAWVDPGNRIWPKFADDTHVVDPVEPTSPSGIPLHWRRDIAIDFGWSHDLVVLWLAWDPECAPTRRCVVYRELYAKGMLLRDVAARIHAASEEDRTAYQFAWCDHDNRSRGELEYALREINQRYRPMSMAKKDRLAGQRCVAGAFGPQRDGFPAIYLMRDRCPRLRAQIINYRRPDLDTPAGRKAREKEDACIEYIDGESVVDGCDALRYGVYSVLEEQFNRTVGYDPGMSSQQRWQQMRWRRATWGS